MTDQNVSFRATPAVTYLCSYSKDDHDSKPFDLRYKSNLFSVSSELIRNRQDSAWIFRALGTAVTRTIVWLGHTAIRAHRRLLTTCNSQVDGSLISTDLADADLHTFDTGGNR